MLSAVSHALEWLHRRDRQLAQDRLLYTGCLIALAVFAAFVGRSAVTGDWFRSGNDMEYILPPLRSATGADVARWLHGSWIGVELFNYYRPVTSLLWLGEYRLFGESVPPYQVVSVVLHGASAVMLALLVGRVFRSPMAGLFGAVLWADRRMIVATLEWTPAQTDVFAGFFSVAALLLWQVFLDTRRRGYLLLPTAAVLMVLAMGSKEIALTTPLLAALLAIRAPQLSRREKVLLAGAACVVLVAFFAWRTHSLGGLGFTPGKATAGRSAGATLTPGKFGIQMLKYLLPHPLGPLAPLSPYAVAVALATGLLVYRLRQQSQRLAAGTAGFAATTLLFGGPDYLLIPDTYQNLIAGALALAAVAFVVRNRPWDSAFLVTYGLFAHLPLYHVVYNAAGNVTYLPDTYWAMAWGCLCAASLEFRQPMSADRPAPHAQSGTIEHENTDPGPQHQPRRELGTKA